MCKNHNVAYLSQTSIQNPKIKKLKTQFNLNFPQITYIRRFYMKGKLPCKYHEETLGNLHYVGNETTSREFDTVSFKMPQVVKHAHVSQLVCKGQEQVFCLHV